MSSNPDSSAPSRGMSIILVDDNTLPGFEPIEQSFARFGHTAVPGDTPGTFVVDGSVEVVIVPNASPHPEALSMPRGPASAKQEVIERMVGFYIIGALGLPDDPIAADAQMQRITAALVRATPAVAAMLSHGLFFYEADFFARMVENDPSTVATQVSVDLTAGPEPDGRALVLTHGLTRYDWTEFAVVSADFTTAMVYAMDLSRKLVTGKQANLSAGIQITDADGMVVLPVEAPSPVPGKPAILRLDLEATPPKKGLFRRRK